MSRIGRQPVAVPAGVEVKIAENNFVTVKGAKGTLEKALPTEMSIKLEDGQVVVTRPNDLKKMKSLHGLTRTLIQNMVCLLYTSGEGKTGIGRPGPCTPWGKPALGLKTRKKNKQSNKYIVRRRDGKTLAK